MSCFSTCLICTGKGQKITAELIGNWKKMRKLPPNNRLPQNTGLVFYFYLSIIVLLFSIIVANNRTIFVWPWKMVLVSVRFLFYQPMDEKIKTSTLCFPAKENPNMEMPLLDWPIVLQYDVKAKYWLISRKFSGMKFFHLSVRVTN